MKKCAMLLALCCLLTLSACGEKAFDPEQAAQYYGENGYSGEYTVTTHGGVYCEYRLSCRAEADRSVVTILAPQTVAGITAVVQDGQGSLQFEDVILEALTPSIPGFSPMDALQGVLEDLEEDLPVSVEQVGDRVTLEYQDVLADGRETVKRVDLQRDTLAILGAELYLDNTLYLALQMDAPEAAPAQ